MRYLDRLLPTLAENLALDEALLLAAEAGGPEVLRLWEWPSPAVVLGAAGRLHEEVHEAQCRADGVAILRRASGGGTVLLGQGCLVYSLVLAYDSAPGLGEIRASYCHILGRLVDALGPLLPAVACAGTSDLAIAGLKISGNAQQRKRTHLLHHGTLLYAFDVSRMSRYLKSPPRQPDYRAQREHTDFVRNVPLDADTLRARLRQAWSATQLLDVIPEYEVRRLVENKYSRAAWTHRR